MLKHGAPVKHPLKALQSLLDLSPAVDQPFKRVEVESEGDLYRELLEFFPVDECRAKKREELDVGWQ